MRKSGTGICHKICPHANYEFKRRNMSKKPKNCIWNEDNYEYFSSGCGEAFRFDDGGPIDNGFKFCPYCGSPLKEKPIDDESEQARCE